MIKQIGIISSFSASEIFSMPEIGAEIGLDKTIDQIDKDNNVFINKNWQETIKKYCNCDNRLEKAITLFKGINMDSQSFLKKIKEISKKEQFNPQDTKYIQIESFLSGFCNSIDCLNLLDATGVKLNGEIKNITSIKFIGLNVLSLDLDNELFVVGINAEKIEGDMYSKQIQAGRDGYTIEKKNATIRVEDKNLLELIEILKNASEKVFDEFYSYLKSFIQEQEQQQEIEKAKKLQQEAKDKAQAAQRKKEQEEQKKQDAERKEAEQRELKEQKRIKEAKEAQKAKEAAAAAQKATEEKKAAEVEAAQKAAEAAQKAAEEARVAAEVAEAEETKKAEEARVAAEVAEAEETKKAAEEAKELQIAKEIQAKKDKIIEIKASYKPNITEIDDKSKLPEKMRIIGGGVATTLVVVKTIAL